MRLDRLSGICLLIRREVLDRIGNFEECFGLGFFDDDDFCVRAREGGFSLLLAQDVFIHHFGGRTFRALGIDCRRQLEQNFARFQEKWGAARSAGYRLSSPPEARQAARPKVSLCMIVKDEEANLPDCLGSVCELVDEIIVVDTGSTDSTREIATRRERASSTFPGSTTSPQPAMNRSATQQESGSSGWTPTIASIKRSGKSSALCSLD